MQTFLPIVHKASGEIGGQGEPCGMNAPATQFAAAWMALLGADAEPMYCDVRLVMAAQAQADWLAIHDFDQTDPHLGANGSTANERARDAGYRLPNWWPPRGNQIESAIRSWSERGEAVPQLANHDTHFDHMHRQGWYREHIVWGVGAAAATIERGGVFYCVVSAPRET